MKRSDYEIRKAINNFPSVGGESFDYLTTLISWVIPGVGVLKDVKSNFQQERIIEMIKMLNDKEIDFIQHYRAIQNDEKVFNLFNKLVQKCIESGDEEKRKINIAIFTDYYNNEESSRSDFSLSLMDSISLLTEDEILLLAKLVESFEIYNEKRSGDVSSPTIDDVYKELNLQVQEELNYDYDVLGYLIGRLSYAGFLIPPLGAVIGATIFSYKFNRSVIGRLLTIVHQE